ncbi:TetR/AcrR family transcriptional regulator [Devosia oryziradicis]|uniref:TetR/AcrR family transcriptional regulator n=1 Tax=Devosia oryziradicis TaxID=2801335 RepID=A0ABX7BXU8_9HYPH|nr:TetR/AcrR family transcriptional regulator [Devosia oryziradicis]QQR36328.1 TetR/AcrR family transcriptional regulator [Devosia oryziradicis]
MQVRQTQEQRRSQTRRALVSAARTLFAEKGYAGTSTPEIVAAAGVTRGALYHHFADKEALFAAVVEEEHLLMAMTINAAGEGDEGPGPIKALIAGCDIFLDAMQDPGRRQILLIDAPAVLGRAAVDAIDARHGLETLICGLRDAMDAGAMKKLPVEVLARLFSAVFDRAALAAPEELDDYRKTIKALIRGLKA